MMKHNRTVPRSADQTYTFIRRWTTYAVDTVNQTVLYC
jgi:hypothetical protein